MSVLTTDAKYSVTETSVKTPVSQLNLFYMTRDSRGRVSGPILNEKPTINASGNAVVDLDLTRYTSDPWGPTGYGLEDSDVVGKKWPFNSANNLLVALAPGYLGQELTVFFKTDDLTSVFTDGTNALGSATPSLVLVSSSDDVWTVDEGVRVDNVGGTTAGTALATLTHGEIAKLIYDGTSWKVVYNSTP